MRNRTLLGLMLTCVIALGATGIAQADTALTLGADPVVLTYPHRSLLTVGFPTADPATATILAMPVGASEWTTVSASVTATLSVRPKVTTVYKAWLDGVESDPVTVTVKAMLVKPQLPGSIRRFRTVTVKGWMKPAIEVGASVDVRVFKLVTTYTRIGKGHLKKSTSWILYTTRTVPLRAKAGSTSLFWSLRWMPTELGFYKIVVSHEDAGHAYSQRTAYTRVRW